MNKFNLDDRVVYVGSKFSDLKAAVGLVAASIENEPNVYVVDFGHDAYIMSEASLAPYRPTSKEDRGPEVLQSRRRRTEDDE